MGILEFGLMALGGLVLFVIAGIIAAEMDSAIASVVTFVIGILTLNYGFGISILSVFAANPLWIVGAIILYVGVGALYTALWRWPEYIRKNRDRIMSRYNEWARNRKETQDNSFDAFLDSDKYEYNASDHKERLGTWVGYVAVQLVLGIVAQASHLGLESFICQPRRTFPEDWSQHCSKDAQQKLTKTASQRKLNAGCEPCVLV